MSVRPVKRRQGHGIFSAKALLLLAVTAACSSFASGPAAPPVRAVLRVTSPAFRPGALIPPKFTCNGEDVSPELRWSEPPSRTRSLVVIAEDPDAPAGTWVHWVVFDLPAETRQLPENVPKESEIAGGGRQGRNDFDKIGYGGPCPPPGRPHRYFFRIYALDTALGVPSGATKREVLRAAQGHILAQGEYMGRFSR